MNFYDKVVHYSEIAVEKGGVFIKKNSINFVIVVMLITGANLSQRSINTVKYKNQLKEVVTALEKEYSTDIGSRTKGVSYEVTGGIISSYRMIGEYMEFYVYILDDNYEEPFILNNIKNEWLTKPLSIPPLVSQAFIHYDIGIVDKYEDGIAYVNNQKYPIDYSNDRVNIEKYGLYAPMPILSDRNIQFIQKYIEGKYLDLQVIKKDIRKDREIIYAENENNGYSIHIFFDGTVKIGKIDEGMDEIKQNILF